MIVKYLITNNIFDNKLTGKIIYQQVKKQNKYIYINDFYIIFI